MHVVILRYLYVNDPAGLRARTPTYLTLWRGILCAALPTWTHTELKGGTDGQYLRRPFESPIVVVLIRVHVVINLRTFILADRSHIGSDHAT